MASPFPFVKTNTKMGSVRYSVPTGVTRYHSYANSLVNHSTSLGSYSTPKSSFSRRPSTSSYPSASLGAARAASEAPYISTTRHSSLNDPSFRFTMSRLKSHTLNHLSYV